MPTLPTNPLEARIVSTNVGYFLREFSISQTKYTPPGKSEIEFADHVVLVGDVLFLIQSKNRDAPSSDPEREAKWYREVVKSHAVKQIRSTLTQLKSAPPFPNDQDETTHIPRDLGRLTAFKIVIYNMGAALPETLRRRKHRLDDEAGFVHFFHIDDYELVLGTLVTLPEVTEYLSYREEILKRHDAAGAVTERALLGGYLRFAEVIEPREEHAEFVDRLFVDAEAFDISGILHAYRDKIYKHYAAGPDPADLHTRSPLGPYYAVLRQLLRLNRAGLGEFKKRYIWARERCEQDFERPSMFAMIDRDRGHSDVFVFIPIPRGASAVAAANGLRNFTELAKHSVQADRALGVAFRRDGRDFLIDWALIERPWSPDAEIDEMLRTDNPFRPVEGAVQPRYHFRL